MKTELIDQIARISRELTVDEFSSLQLQEQLLTLMVKNNKIDLKTKTKAFEVINMINRRQLETLGRILK